MGFWFKMRCDNPTPVDTCYSFRNAGPREWGGYTMKTMQHMKGLLEAEARAKGWLKRRQGWYCPSCKEGA